MKKSLVLAVLLLCGLSLSASVEEVVEKPVGFQLVNDFAGLFTPEQAQQLEAPLRALYDTTSTQIVVVTVSSLQGYEANEYATTLFNTWGIGDKDKNNGVLILIKPKTDNEPGNWFITSGYGAEGVLPDATCYLIGTREMLPYFKQNDYYGGVKAAIEQIIPLMAGEFTAEQYEQKANEFTTDDIIILVVFFGFMGLLIWYAAKHKGNGTRGGRSGGSAAGPVIFPFTSGGSSSSSGGSWGGGHSGGGGAGGSW